MSDTFNDFIKKKAEVPEKTGLSLEDELKLWKVKLEELYDLMRESLAESVAEGSVQITMDEMQLHEEQLGSYTVRSAKITVGRHVVTLTPIGTFLIGARGRLDMKGPFGLVRLVIVPPNAERIRVYINQEPPELPAPETWVWKITTPPPRISYKDLTSDSFRSALMEVLGG